MLWRGEDHCSQAEKDKNTKRSENAQDVYQLLLWQSAKPTPEENRNKQGCQIGR